MPLLSDAIRERAERPGLPLAQAIAYRLGALEARLIIKTATEAALSERN